MAGLFGKKAVQTTLIFAFGGKQFPEASGLIIQDPKTWPLKNGRADIEAEPGQVLVMFRGMPPFPLELGKEDLGQTLPLELKADDVLAIRQAAAAGAPAEEHGAHDAHAGGGHESHDAHGGGHGGHEEHAAPAGVNWQKLVVLLLVAFIAGTAGWFWQKGYISTLALAANADAPTTKATIIVAYIVFAGLAIVNRLKNEQISDIVAAVAAVIAWFVAGNVQSEFMQGALCVGGVAVAYWAAVTNTPDLTIMGAFWKTIAMGAYLFGARGLAPESVSTLALFQGLWLFGDLHIFADMLQITQRIRKHGLKETGENVSFMILVLVFYYTIREVLHWDPYVALLVVGAVFGLVGEMMEEGFKNFDESKLNTGWSFFDTIAKGFGKFARTQKADGAAIGVSIVVALKMFVGFG